MTEKQPVRTDYHGDPVYEDDTEIEKFHKTIAYILTFGFIIVLFFYNFLAFDLPYRHKVIHITNKDGKEMLLNKLIKDYSKTKDTIFDFNEDCREKEYEVSGIITVGKIEQESNNSYKIYSEGCYNQYKKTLLDFDNIDSSAIDGSQTFRTIVIYVNTSKDKLEIIKTGDKIKFKSNFNNMNDTYLVLTEGEILE